MEDVAAKLRTREEYSSGAFAAIGVFPAYIVSVCNGYEILLSAP